jgi:hypothetical protein
MIYSRIPLTHQEEELLSQYFSRYELAIDINKAMRGEQTVSQSPGELRQQGVTLAKIIRDKGLLSAGDEVLYRSMDCAYLDDTERAQLAPVGVDVPCLVTAASIAQGAKFGGSKHTFAISLPANESYIRHSRIEFGVGEWSEYLLGPGTIWHFGNYDAVVFRGEIPVMYTSKPTGALEFFTIKYCLLRAGMRFAEHTAKALAFLESGRIIPVLAQYGEPRPSPARLVEMPWGVEETNVDGTLSIFDVRRANADNPARIKALRQAEARSTEHYNGIMYRFY